MGEGSERVASVAIPLRKMTRSVLGDEITVGKYLLHIVW